jgi:sugar-specific transcriptional regulator TrmB
MPFNEEFELYLHEMGLSEYESAAYLALLRQGQGTAKEISNASDIPQSRVYDVLEKLERRGFVTIQMGRPKRYGAIEPDLAVEQYLNYKRNEFDASISKIENIGDQFVKELQSNQFQYKHHDEFDVFWSYEGKNYLLEQGGQLLANANTGIRMLTTANSFRRIVGHHKELLAKKADEGVEIRVLVNNFEQLDDVVIETAREWAVVRAAENIEGRIYLFDTDRILITFRNDLDTRYVGILTQSSQMYTTLSHLFELTWEEYVES